MKLYNIYFIFNLILSIPLIVDPRNTLSEKIFRARVLNKFVINKNRSHFYRLTWNWKKSRIE